MATNFNGQAPAPRRNPAPATLPSRDVTDNSIADAYAAFILYCNPAVPSDTDSIDLKTLFRTSPKSDGKSFSIFILYQLICKLEAKEIKTWAELALELGVELPVLEKGQSPQKVQQYAVRLKRWMHAMHVDAFFEYLRGKSHIYWTQVPLASDPIPEERDGVPNEEDLALRALLPETRPKRGRKRAGEKAIDPAGETSNAARRRRIHSQQEIEHVRESWSRTPSTDDRFAAEQESRKLLEARLEAWAASTETGSAFTEGMPHRASAPERSVEKDHQHPDRRLTHPLYRHPASRSPNIEPFTPQDAEVQDTAESTPRPRRKTGPVVSSAWRSSSAAEGSKLRGRPPGNRNMSDGQYTTFPVVPEVRTTPNNEVPAQIHTTEPPRPELWSRAVGNCSNTSMGVGGNGPLSEKLRLPLPLSDRPLGSLHYPMSPPIGSTNSPNSNAFNGHSPSNYSTQNNRPSPQHYASKKTGPSPSNYSMQRNGPSLNHQHQSYPPQYHHRSVETYIQQPRQPSITTSYYAADNSAPASASASNVSPVTNSSATNSSTAPSSHLPQQPRLTIESQSSQPEEEDNTNVEAIEICYMQCILGASWEDNDGGAAPPPNADEALRLVKQLLKHMKENAKDDSSYLINIAAMAGGRLLNKKMVLTRAEDNQRETIYKSHWRLKYGGIESVIQLECAVPKPGWDQNKERRDDGLCDPMDVDGLERDGEVDWKRKYEELHEFAVERSRKLRELKKTVLEGVLAAKDKI